MPLEGQIICPAPCAHVSYSLISRAAPVLVVLAALSLPLICQDSALWLALSMHASVPSKGRVRCHECLDARKSLILEKSET